MFLLTGTIIDVLSTESKDRETGVISQVYTVEVLHRSRGKSEVVSLKIDIDVVDSWRKFKGKDCHMEIRFYAMKNRDGGVQQGVMLTDKKILPTLRAPVPV